MIWARCLVGDPSYRKELCNLKSCWGSLDRQGLFGHRGPLLLLDLNIKKIFKIEIHVSTYAVGWPEASLSSERDGLCLAQKVGILSLM